MCSFKLSLVEHIYKGIAVNHHGGCRMAMVHMGAEHGVCCSVLEHTSYLYAMNRLSVV